jgi:two-component system, NtrC family, response regulator AlgB
MHVLLIDDDPSLRKSIRLALETMDHRVSEARNGSEAHTALRHHLFDIAFLDLRLGKEEGLAVLPALLRTAPALPVIVITAYATIETAVEAMRRGAFDYLPKPFTPDQLRLVLDRVAHMRQLQSQVAALEDQIQAIVPEADLKTEEPAMRLVLDMAFKAAASDVTILLRGASGTGKGVLARAIHARSARAAAPFVMVHCPSLSAELLESELFGHVRGAFTGAVTDTLGKVTVAEGGTLFLDEVGELPLALQPKLLRLLQDKCYERVGDTHTRVGNLRIIAASNRDLAAAVAGGTFREDLLYRLNVIEVLLPSLLERHRDILPLAEHLLRFFARQSGKPAPRITDEARAAMGRYPWPGNIRELRNAIERGIILASGSDVGLADLPAQIGATPPQRAMVLGGAVTLEELEAEHIRRLLTTTPTIEQAASLLGIFPSTLYRKRKRYGL